MNTRYLKSFVGGLKSNFLGYNNVNDKFVIIESDDWGAIRTPSATAISAFERHGFELEKSLYKVDSLASKSDLEDLLDLLSGHRNSSGRSPVITANAIMANPDFEKIKESDYMEYFYEPFTTTLQNYPEHQSSLALWQKGESEGVFIPEYHGREHLNVKRWLCALQAGDVDVRFSFDWRCTYSGKGDYAFMEAYDWDHKGEVEQHAQIIKDGALIFERTFGRKPRSFIAPCYNWDAALENTISELGVSWIQGNGAQKVPTGQFNCYESVKHKFGEHNGFGSRYNVRNVFFEPVNNPHIDWTNRAMARIQAAFLLNKPAVISTHRLNYIGYIDPKNKENGLKHLNRLLKSILKKWPEVEFISTAELSNYIRKS